MRSTKYFALLTALAFALSIAAVAKDHNQDSASFDLAQTATVGSTTLHPGRYKAEWSGPNDALKISILQGNKTVATAQGEMKQLSSKAQNDSVTVKQEPDNTMRVEEIDFNKRTEALVISGM